jgi:hypothetical protein
MLAALKINIRWMRQHGLNPENYGKLEWAVLRVDGQASYLIVRKYSGSHRKLRPAGAEYELNDGLLKNVAARSGFP